MTSENSSFGPGSVVDLAHEPPFRLGGLEVRPATREVMAPEGPHPLEPRVMQALVAIARADGAVVTRDELIASCWDGRIVGEDAINRVISKLHRVSEIDGGSSFSIETIPRVGYRLKLARPPAASAAKITAARRWRISRPKLVASLGLLLLLVVGGAAWWTWQRRPPEAPSNGVITIAVLPFEDFMADGPDRYIAAGVAREVRNTLARTRGLRVIADSSSFAVASQNLPAPEMGRRLGADLLLDGSVRRSGQNLRASAELVDVRTGVQVWSETHQDSSGDLFRLQDAVASAVARELIVRAGEGVLVEAAPARRRHPEAFRRVLEAGELMERGITLNQSDRSQDAVAMGVRARTLLQEALRIDPREAEAMLLLSRLRYVGHSTVWENESREEGIAYTTQMVDRALAVDPNAVGALVARGELDRRLLWHWSRAEVLFRRALAIDPNDADGHTWYAYLLSTTGRCRDGVVHARLAARLDPAFAWRRLAEPRLLYCAGRRREAYELYASILRENPEHVFLAREIYLRLLVEADPEALRGYARFLRTTVWRGRKPPQAIEETARRAEAGADALKGRPGGLLALVRAEIASLDAGPRGGSLHGRWAPDLRFTLAMELAWTGQTGPALDQLEAAVRAGSIYIGETLPFGAQEFPEPVRSHPRYLALWRDDPRLVELMRLRARAQREGQMPAVGRS